MTGILLLNVKDIYNYNTESIKAIFFKSSIIPLHPAFLKSFELVELLFQFCFLPTELIYFVPFLISFRF